MSEPERPDPPIVGKVSHNSIELYWGVDLKVQEQVGLPPTRKDERLHFVVQEEEVGSYQRGYGTVYSGFSSRHVFEGLEPKSKYRFRLRSANDYGASPWSASVEVATVKKPASSEDLHKATSRNDVEAVERVLGELSKDLINAPDKFGYSSLMIAIQKGHHDIARILLEHHADVDYQSNGGKNALMVAAYTGNLKGIELLNKYKVNLEARDKTGSTALHWAADGKSFEVVRWLVNKRVELDKKDYTSGWTPLMRLAATSGDDNIGRILIHHGAEVNSTDHDGKSVLMMASLNGHVGLVRLLVNKGANISKKSEHGKTALDFAKSFDHRQVTLFLEDEMNKIKLKEKERRIADSMKDQRSGIDLPGIETA